MHCITLAKSCSKRSLIFYYSNTILPKSTQTNWPTSTTFHSNIPRWRRRSIYETIYESKLRATSFGNLEGHRLIGAYLSFLHTATPLKRKVADERAERANHNNKIGVGAYFSAHTHTHTGYRVFKIKRAKHWQQSPMNR